ncbi:MAG: winged helix-turn-helix domain-containing protein [Chloroflexi bacterium]|nr:winged helix-turn-helix domain-containing protein [Chloroflexota bacterium]
MQEKRKMAQVSVPTLDKFMSPLLLVLHRLGGAGTNDEMRDGVAEILRLTEDQLDVLHAAGGGTQTEVEYRLSLARRYLKKYGLLENPKPRSWKLSAKGSSVVRVNPYAVILYYREKTWEESMQRVNDLLPDLTDIDETMSW